MLATSIDVLANNTADPLVGEDVLSWSELFSLEDAMSLEVFGALVSIDGTTSHAFSATCTARRNVEAFLGGHESIDATKLKVFEDVKQTLEAQVVPLEVEFQQEFLDCGELQICLVCHTRIGQCCCDFFQTVRIVEKRHHWRLVGQ
mgnify:CR=1 FL=1